MGLRGRGAANDGSIDKNRGLEAWTLRCLADYGSMAASLGRWDGTTADMPVDRLVWARWWS